MNIPCELGKNVYSSVVRQSILWMTTRYYWLMVLFSLTIYLLIFYLLDLSITDKGVWKSPATIVELHISPYIPVSVGLVYFDALLLGIYTLIIVIPSCFLFFFYHFSLCNVPSSFLVIFLALKLSLFEINIAVLTFFWLLLAWYIFLHSLPLINLYK